MIKAAKLCSQQVTRAAQQSARQCYRFGSAFRGVFSVTLLRRRAMERLSRVRRSATIIAVNILNHLRVNQVLAMQYAPSSSRLSLLSHYWLHAADPHVD